jgi:hypothetical protein
MYTIFRREALLQITLSLELPISMFLAQIRILGLGIEIRIYGWRFGEWSWGWRKSGPDWCAKASSVLIPIPPFTFTITFTLTSTLRLRLKGVSGDSPFHNSHCHSFSLLGLRRVWNQLRGLEAILWHQALSQKEMWELLREENKNNKSWETKNKG